MGTIDNVDNTFFGREKKKNINFITLNLCVSLWISSCVIIHIWGVKTPTRAAKKNIFVNTLRYVDTYTHKQQKLNIEHFHHVQPNDTKNTTMQCMLSKQVTSVVTSPIFSFRFFESSANCCLLFSAKNVI